LSERRVNIVGVGGTLMGDDGVGPAVVGLLESRGLDGLARAWDAGLALSDVLGMLDPAEPLIIIDAVKGGGPPGSIYRFPYEDAEVAVSSQRMLSLHELGIAEALRMEALSGRLFRDVTIFGIEPAAVGWGEGLSKEVAAAADRLAELIIEHLRKLSTGAPAASVGRP
jgi:hydrogenase maturation protease